MINFVHLFPYQLGLNGEKCNLDCLQTRLSWVGVESARHEVTTEADLPSSVDAVFVGSGTLSGALEALEGLRPFQQKIQELASQGVPILALGLGWEILGQSIALVDGSERPGLGVYSSRSKRVSVRASCESFGFDASGNLTAGYSNHSSEMELSGDSKPLIRLSVGFGNSSITAAQEQPEEGFLLGNLMAARLNGPLLPLNPHLADQFLSWIAARSGIEYLQDSAEANEADDYALNARREMQRRLLS